MDRWYVIKNDERSGPFTAQEIRAKLREGTVDPFDFVCREDSNVRRPIIEVDELFESQSIAYEQPFDGIKDSAIDDAPKTMVSNFQLDNSIGQFNRPTPESSVPEPSSVSARLNSPAPRTPAFLQNDVGKKDQKKYYVLAPNGTSGPFSPKEIVAMYAAGSIDAKARVSRDGAGKKFAIHKFVAAYADPNRKLPRGGGKKGSDGIISEVGLPNIRAMEEMAREREALRMAKLNARQAMQRPMALALVVAGIVAIIGWGLIANRSTWQRWSLSEGFRESTEGLSARSPDEPRETRENLEPIAITPRKASPPIRRTPPAPRRPRVAAAPPPAPPPPIVAPQPRAVPPPIVRPAPARPARPRPAQVAAIPRQTAPQRPRPGGNPLSAKVGQVARFGPVSFNRAALGACPIQCRIAFVDRNGNQVTGVFFKGVFADYLTTNTAPLYIRGTVSREGSDYVMFLQKWW